MNVLLAGALCLLLPSFFARAASAFEIVSQDLTVQVGVAQYFDSEEDPYLWDEDAATATGIGDLTATAVAIAGSTRAAVAGASLIGAGALSVRFEEERQGPLNQDGNYWAAFWEIVFEIDEVTPYSLEGYQPGVFVYETLLFDVDRNVSVVSASGVLAPGLYRLSTRAYDLSIVPLAEPREVWSLQLVLVPEPGSVALLAVGLVILSRRRAG